MRGQRKNPRKAVQPFENKKRKIDIFKNYEANGVEKIQRKLEIFSTLISKKSSQLKSCEMRILFLHGVPLRLGCLTVLSVFVRKLAASRRELSTRSNPARAKWDL